MCPLNAPLQYGSSCCTDLPSCLAGSVVNVDPSIVLPILPTIPASGGIVPTRVTISGTITNVVNIYTSPSSSGVTLTSIATITFPPGAFSSSSGHDVHGVSIVPPSTNFTTQDFVKVITPVFDIILDDSSPSTFLPTTIAFSSSSIPLSVIADLPDLCLGYINSDNLWVCQDRKLVLLSDGGITGLTTHFTPFALINYPADQEDKSQGSSSSHKTKVYVGVFVTLGVLLIVGAAVFIILKSRGGRFNRMRDDTHSTNSVVLSEMSK